MCVRVCVGVRAWVCVFVRTCVFVCVCFCVCLCVCECVGMACVERQISRIICSEARFPDKKGTRICTCMSCVVKKSLNDYSIATL